MVVPLCSTGHLATVPFDEKAFENEMMVSQDFERSALAPLATLGQPVCQELYRDVAMIRAWDSRKNGEKQSVEKEWMFFSHENMKLGNWI